MHRAYIDSQRLLSWFSGNSRSSTGNNLLGVPRMLLTRLDLLSLQEAVF